MRVRVIHDEQGKIIAGGLLDTPDTEGIHPVIEKRHTDKWGPVKEVDLEVPAEYSHMDFATLVKKLKVDTKGKPPALTLK